jgi:hypothetical protein
MSDSGAPLHDLTGGGKVYPDDVYGPNAARYYGSGEDEAADMALFAKLHALRGKPDELVDVFRAVPPEAFVGGRQPKFQTGDWVTPSRRYAVQHGESTLGGKYKIMRARFPAKAIFTNGDSAYEAGLDRSVLEAMAPRAANPQFRGPDIPKIVRDRVAAGEQGFTLDPRTGMAPEGGFAYSAFPRQEAQVPWNATGADRGEVGGYLKRNERLLRQPGTYAGGWVDPASWKAELNVSRLAPDENEAKGVLDLLNQKAAWDIKGNREVLPDPLPRKSIDADRTNAWFADPANQQQFLNLRETGKKMRQTENLPPWWDMYGTPIEEVWGAERVPEYAKKLAYTAPGQNINSNLGIANKAMAEKAAGLPYSGTNARYPNNARAALAKSEQPWPKNPMITNPKTFSMEMAPFVDTSPFDSLRFWRDLMKQPTSSPDRAGSISFFDNVRKLMDNNPTTVAPDELLRDFVADAWSGMKPTPEMSGGVGYQMERRIQNAMTHQPMVKDKPGTYKWVRRAQPLTRDEAIQAMRRGEVWGAAAAPAIPALQREEDE